MSTTTTTASASATAQERWRAVRSSAPVLIRPLVPRRPVEGFVTGAVLVGIAILLVALRPATATLVASGPLLLLALWMLAAALWNETHRDAVSDALGARRLAVRASMRRHPVFWLTVLPVVAGLRAVARLHTDHGHAGVAVVLGVGLGVWAVALAGVAFAVRRARAQA